MPNFQYKALDAKGEETIGTVTAGNEAEAIQQIRALNLHPTQIAEEGKGKIAKSKAPAAAAKGKGKAKPTTKGKTGGRIKPKNLMIFTRQLATLIDSGLPLLR